MPDIANFASFAFDEAGEFAFASGYGITLKADAKESPAYLLGLLKADCLIIISSKSARQCAAATFRYFTQFIEQLPIKRIDPKNKREVKLEKEIVECVEAIRAAHKQRLKLPDALHRKIAHSQNRTPCNLAHYLQKDFAAAVKPEILIDDVQRTGFVHEIRLESNGNELTFTATVTDKLADKPRPLPVLRLAFKDDALRQFIYAVAAISECQLAQEKVDDRQKAGAGLSAPRQHARTAGLFQFRRG